MLDEWPGRKMMRRDERSDKSADRRRPATSATHLPNSMMDLLWYFGPFFSTRTLSFQACWFSWRTDTYHAADLYVCYANNVCTRNDGTWWTVAISSALALPGQCLEMMVTLKWSSWTISGRFGLIFLSFTVMTLIGRTNRIFGRKRWDNGF